MNQIIPSLQYIIKLQLEKQQEEEQKNIRNNNSLSNPNSQKSQNVEEKPQGIEKLKNGVKQMLEAQISKIIKQQELQKNEQKLGEYINDQQQYYEPETLKKQKLNNGQDQAILKNFDTSSLKNEDNNINQQQQNHTHLQLNQEKQKTQLTNSPSQNQWCVLDKNQWDDLHYQIENSHQYKIYDRVQVKRVCELPSKQFTEYTYGAEFIFIAIQIREKYMNFLYNMQSQNPNSDNEFVEFSQKGRPYINWNKSIPQYEKIKDLKLNCENGIYHVVQEQTQEKIWKIISKDEFLTDFKMIEKIVYDKKTISLAKERLLLLKQKFKMHQILNHNKEIEEQKLIGENDFESIPKIDTHIHHTASMNSKELCDFIKEKFKLEPEREVYFDEKQQKPLTLKQVFQNLKINENNINMDSLSVKADKTIFQRFDNFNEKFSPLQSSELRWIFFGGRENYIQGQYLGELTKRMMNQLENENIYQEWRFSICGRYMNEWQQFALWVQENDLNSSKVRWMIQIPRTFDRQLHYGVNSSFQEMIDKIFKPLFEVTLDPNSDPILFQVLCSVGGFDSVDDESVQEQDYLASGDINHLIAGFLTADGINHGIQLKESSTLQYLYYLQQIGLAMSPLSNNKVFFIYIDDPLILHLTKQPLLEEYAIATQVWDLNLVDLCEIARFSIIQSSFPETLKVYWLGNYKSLTPESNNSANSNLPPSRYIYRIENLKEEFSFLFQYGQQAIETQQE